jgi:hypothetical protein
MKVAARIVCVMIVYWHFCFLYLGYLRFGFILPEADISDFCSQSGRSDSNRRRPAWEADILPLNYARKCFVYTTL